MRTERVRGNSPSESEDPFDRWIRELESRSLSDLTFPEISRALRALSSLYVERRSKLREGVALSGAGKRAAFALFYGPLHYLLVRHIAASLEITLPPQTTIVDLGCGTGASGAALANGSHPPSHIAGIDRNAWALRETALAYRAFGIAGRTRLGDAVAVAWPKGPALFLAAFTVNELSASDRERLLARLSERIARGDATLIVEPLAGSAAPWWDEWTSLVGSPGGRADRWRFAVDLPAIVAKLDRAAGLDHRVLTGRSLWVPGRT
jgi:hypothetical protein